MKKAYRLVYYVPIEDSEKVKKAIFAVGAGKIGNYDCCCFELKGTGQFRPLKGSAPAIGEYNKIEKVSEIKVELICQLEIIKDVIRVLKDAHPYEEVAFQFWEVAIDI
ncbi:NGG1p interacting factor NIF3 [Lentisphaerota bacterium WC36G]|nr:NGG1p interacting factor NIF3 [Lentisphaerae bacterium WC36]